MLESFHVRLSLLLYSIIFKYVPFPCPIDIQHRFVLHKLVHPKSASCPIHEAPFYCSEDLNIDMLHFQFVDPSMDNLGPFDLHSDTFFVVFGFVAASARLYEDWVWEVAAVRIGLLMLSSAYYSGAPRHSQCCRT